MEIYSTYPILLLSYQVLKPVRVILCLIEKVCQEGAWQSALNGNGKHFDLGFLSYWKLTCQGQLLLACLYSSESFIPVSPKVTRV